MFLNRKDGKLRINIPFLYMNMNRPVVIGVEHKSKAKEVKYGRHPQIFFSKTNIGNIFITCKKKRVTLVTLFFIFLMYNF